MQIPFGVILLIVVLCTSCEGMHNHKVIEEKVSSDYLYTTMYLQNKMIQWSTCGHAGGTSGCYGSGSFGPFVNPCSVAKSGNYVYVLDSHDASGNFSISIYYLVQSSSPSSHLIKNIVIPEYAGLTGKCFLASLGDFAYFGISSSPLAGILNTKLTKYTTFSQCGSDHLNSAITSNENSVSVSQSGCFTTFDSSGAMTSDGGEFTPTFVISNTGYSLD